MLVTQLFQTRFAGASTIDQMLDDKVSGAFDSQLRQGHYGAQQFANVCHREWRQLVDLQFFNKFRIARMLFAPVEFGLSDEPGCQTRECQMVFPGWILLRPQLIPTGFTFGFAIGDFNKEALAFAASQTLERGFSRRIRQGVMNAPVSLASHHQPLLYGLLTVVGRPNQARVELIVNCTAFGRAHKDTCPLCSGISGQAPSLNWFVGAQHSWTRESSPTLVRIFRRQTDHGLLQIDLSIGGHVGHIDQPGPSHLSPQPVTTPVERVATNPFKGQSFTRYSLNHLPSQLDLRGKLPIMWDAESTALFRHLPAEPVFGQKQFTINPSPDAVVGIGQECPDLAHLDLTQPPVVLPSCSSSLLRDLLVSAFVKNQCTTTGELRCLAHFFANLRQRLLRFPGRIAHKVLHILRGDSRRVRDIGEVSLFRHAQQPAQVVQSIVTGIAGLSLETLGVARPKFIQPMAQLLDRRAWQAPSTRVKDFAFILIFSAGPHLFGMPAIRLFLNCLALDSSSAEM